MKRPELIAAFLSGDIGDVEFTELMLEAGASVEEIGETLSKARREMEDDEC